MFEATQLVFYYALSPVHMGAGSAIGAIDNPIQREVHTEHPMFAGSGLKGAARHRCNRVWGAKGSRDGDGLVDRIFGPDTNASDHAGAVAFSDAQLVALPVRALREAYVYITSPLALARLKRMADFAGTPVDWVVPAVAPGEALVADARTLVDNRLVLEAFEFNPTAEGGTEIAAWLSLNALPCAASHAFFAEKLKRDLVVLNDADFGHFSRHAMVVEPHVRISDDTGTADAGGLFFTENLPAEAVLAGVVQASVERYSRRDAERLSEENRLNDANEVLDAVLNGPGVGLKGIAGAPLQIGGDATTGRGLVLLNPANTGGPTDG